MILLIDSDIKERKSTRETLAASYCVYKLDNSMYPLTYQMIDKYEHKYKELVAKLIHANYHTKYFQEGGIFTQ